MKIWCYYVTVLGGVEVVLQFEGLVLGHRLGFRARPQLVGLWDWVTAVGRWWTVTVSGGLW